MLIKEIQKEKTEDVLYESSNITSSSYNRTTGLLEIVFSRGVKYEYEYVMHTDYLGFKKATSQGEGFNKYIKKYKYKILGNVNVAEIISEINNYDKPKLSEEDVELLEKIKTIVSEMEKKDSLKSEDLVSLNDLIVGKIFNIDKEGTVQLTRKRFDDLIETAYSEGYKIHNIIEAGLEGLCK